MSGNRWQSTGRMLGVGLALMLLLGASGEGCGGSGGGDTDCPTIEAAGTASLTAAAAVSLPAGDLDEDIERAREIAQDVADATDSPCERSSQGVGYKVAIDFKKRHPILARVMARSKRRENYYRVTIANTGAVDSDGELSEDADDTHHDLPDDVDDAVDEILDLIDKTKEHNK